MSDTPASASDIILYCTDDGQERIEVRLEHETVWLSQAGLAELFETTVSNINIHLKNIFEEGELDQEATFKDSLIVQKEGSREVMGLTTWKGAKVRKTDVTVAKNYLSEEEVFALNRLVTMYLDFAEDQAKRRKQIFQQNWRAKLDAFLELNERDILQSAGQVTKELADELAREQYDAFHANRLVAEDGLAELAHDEELRAIEASIPSSGKKPEGE